MPNRDTVAEWIAREAITFSFDDQFGTAVDRMVASLGPGVELLGLGEPTHGAEEFVVLRNRIFERLVEAHGYTAIAIESSFPRGRLADDFVNGRIGGTFDDIQETGFSHHSGRSAANRALIEWMRHYNAAQENRLRFYGFDSPTEMTHADSPRQLLEVALELLVSVNDAGVAERRKRIDELLGADAAWEDRAAAFDPSKSIGLSPNAAALRLETEDLIAHLRMNRPQFALADGARYAEAVHSAVSARGMLNYHAAMAGSSPNRIAELLGLRDLMMADNLAYIVERERRRGGKVFAFAHNSHLQRGEAQWQWGTHSLTWWPAGSHVHQTLGDRYAVIGTGAVELAAHGVSLPEADTLEALLAAGKDAARFVPTHRGTHLDPGAVAAVVKRSGSLKNLGYFPLTAQSLTDFDALIVLS